MAAGAFHNCAVVGGQGYCWGENESGQLGTGGTADSHSPVAVAGLNADVVQFALGEQHSYALHSDGIVHCWGYPEMIGQSDGSYLPVDVPDLEAGAISIDSQFWHSCAVMSGATVKCWGYNGDRQLGGDCGLTMCAAPIEAGGLTEPVLSVAVGRRHTCVLTEVGGVECWGHNHFGYLGNGTTTPSASPVGVSGLIGGVEAVAAGTFNSCALTTSGGVKCWGLDIDITQSELNQSIYNTFLEPVDIPGLESGVTAIALGDFHGCALMAVGGVKCWGNDESGQLGDGGASAPSTSVPVSVVDLPGPAIAIAAGALHTCAIVEGAGAVCWGANSSGQLGDGTNVQSSTPVNVADWDPSPPKSTPTVTTTPTLSPTPSLTSTPTTTPSNTPTPTSTRTPTPTPTLTPTPQGTGPGDVNCLYGVDSIDALLLLQLVAALLDSLPCEGNGDINGGGVDSIDALLILQYVTGLIDSLPP
jgi:alpha-tubulin suppressor-like RCC1 family protein